MKKQILFLLLTTLIVGAAYSQATRTLTGKVMAEGNRSELIGASLAIKGGKGLGSTDADGRFSVEVPVGETVTITVSYIGYDSKNVTVKPTENNIAVLLAIAKSSLDSVVVTVGYTRQKKALVLGSVATIDAEDVQDIPVANLATALIGRVPGVSISQTSGKPGATTNLTIRNPVSFSGAATGGSNDPLFVIDGFQLTKQDFDNLDATLIEEITFLKDAAASIYGARGANGVVLVTTKRGRPGKLRINYSGSYGVSSAIKMPEMLSAYDHALLLNAKYSTYGTANFVMNPWQFYTDQELEYLKTNNFNRVDEVWQNSHLNRHTINISGGSDRISLFGGANYYDEDGNLSDLYVKKYGIRFGANVKITKGLTTTVSVASDFSQLNRPAPKGALGNNVTEQGDQLNGTMSSLLLSPAWTPLTFNGLPVGSPNVWNPLELQKSGSYSRSRTQGFTLNASLEYKFQNIEGLTARVQYGLNTRNTFGKEYYVPYQLAKFNLVGNHGRQPIPDSLPPLPPGKFYTNFNITSPNVIMSDTYVWETVNNGNFISEDHDYYTNYQLNETVSYARKFGNHDLSVLVGAEQSEGKGENFKIVLPDVVVPGVDQLYAFSSDRSKSTISGSSNEIGRMSYFGRLNYNFSEKYLVEATFRADASPNFPPQSRWGYFPSVAVGWAVSEERFFKNLFPFFNNFKFRYQYGLTGNDNVQNYQYRLSYAQPGRYYLYGNTVAGVLDLTAGRTTPNPNITWEKARYNNFGVDGNLLNRRLSFSFDYYRRYNYDMLAEPTNTLPTTSGAVVSDINYAKMKSWGTEASVTWSDNAFSSKFRYSITTNFTWADNRVLQRFYNPASDTGYKNPINRRTDSGIEGLIFTGILRTQAELDAFKAAHPGYRIDGDTLRLGYATFKDINGDNNINSLDRTRIVGRSGAKFGMSFNIGLSYTDFKLSANVSWSQGGKVAYDKTARTPPNENTNSLSIWKDSWSPTNPNATYPVTTGKFISEVYDLWIVDATVMRVNNMTLSYSLPAKLATRYRIPQFRAYITGTNLWDIINHRPYKYSASNVAVDYPALRTWTFALSISI